MRRTARNLLVTGLAGSLLALTAGPANAALSVRAMWHMDKLPTMVDSAGGDNNGTPSNVELAGKAYRFNGTSSTVAVPDKSNLDPGTAGLRLTAKVSIARLPGTRETFDIVRKGTTTTSGGYYKMEIARSATGTAVARCRVEDSAGTDALVTGTASLPVGSYVTVTCTRTATGLTVAAGGKSSTVAVATKTISNASGVTVGSKGDGTDWFPGLMDFVRIEIG